MSTIRNYQGELPKGLFHCEGCSFSTQDLEEAAQHSEDKNSWVWLVPDNPEDKTFEIHPSDWDGVYLSLHYQKKTYNDIVSLRNKMKHK